MWTLFRPLNFRVPKPLWPQGNPWSWRWSRRQQRFCVCSTWTILPTCLKKKWRHISSPSTCLFRMTDSGMIRLHVRQLPTGLCARMRKMPLPVSASGFRIGLRLFPVSKSTCACSTRKNSGYPSAVAKMRGRCFTWGMSRAATLLRTNWIFRRSPSGLPAMLQVA